MTVAEAIKKLDALEERLFAFTHASKLIRFDGVTTAPKNTSAPRAKTTGILSGETHKINTGEEMQEVLRFIEEHADEFPAKVVRRVEIKRRKAREMEHTPVEEYMAYNKLISEAGAVWRKVKHAGDYDTFEPYLARIIEAKKRFASVVAPDMAPYDYCLDQYEEGLTMEKCAAFFSTLRDRLVPLVKKISELPEPDTSILNVNFPVEKQKILSLRLMDFLGIDHDKCGIAETEHPFSTNFSKYDSRITTHYYDSFSPAMYSVLHESGHALYGMHPADEDTYNCLGGGASMGVHESQSRFFENLIGRTREFCEYIFPTLVELCPEIGAYTPEDLYKAVNCVKPSLIRIEADELTYYLHIMVRYEMERDLMSGKITTKEVPERWNALYKEYLGVDVPDNTRGVLQDSHWSSGQIGYFPSYAIGSAYGAQLIAKMKETVDVQAAIKSGDLTPVKAWLEERIWKHGSFYKPSVIMEMAMEAPFDPNYYADYLETKMKEVYGIS